MKLTKLVELIDGKLLTNINIDGKEIAGAMGADLMSDVLTSIKPSSVLLTGRFMQSSSCAHCSDCRYS